MFVSFMYVYVYLYLSFWNPLNAGAAAFHSIPVGMRLTPPPSFLPFPIRW